MHNWTLVLLIVAAVLFGIETVFTRSLVAAGLLAATLAFLIPMFG